MKLKEIKPNGIGTVECVIVAIEEKTNRNNGTFLNIGISDGESQVIAKKWNEKAETFMFKPGQAVLIEVKMEEYKGEPSYIIREITESSADPSYTRQPEDAACTPQQLKESLRRIRISS